MARGELGNTVIEIQRNGNYRVCLTEDEVIRVSDIPTKELADQVDKAISQAYHQGTLFYRKAARWEDDDDD